jgi:hypothetical protein
MDIEVFKPLGSYDRNFNISTVAFAGVTVRKIDTVPWFLNYSGLVTVVFMTIVAGRIHQ